MTSFFARPYLLFCAPFLAAFFVLYFRYESQQLKNTWNTYLAPELAAVILKQHATASTWYWSPKWLAITLSLLLSLSLAGIGYKLPQAKQPQIINDLIIMQYLPPVAAKGNATEPLLQLSQKTLIPVLNQRHYGRTGLIFYAGSSHLASPLTVDSASLVTLFSLAHPEVMPLAGNNPAAAFQLALNLSQPTNPTTWVWLLDSLPNLDVLQTALQLKPKHVNLIVIELHTSKLTPAKQKILEAAAGQVLAPEHLQNYLDNSRLQQQQVMNNQGLSWFQELSHWPLLLAMALMLWHFYGQPRFVTKSLKLVFIMGLSLGLSLHSAPSQALSWQSQTAQATNALLQGNFKLAKQLATTPEIQAHIYFANQNYSAAAQAFTQVVNNLPAKAQRQLAIAWYNLGTAQMFALQSKTAVTSLRQAATLNEQYNLELNSICINLFIAEFMQTNQHLPTSTAINQRCNSADKEPSSTQANSANSEIWQASSPVKPSASSALNTQDTQQLQQLEEDPWRLLKFKFRAELKEQRYE